MDSNHILLSIITPAYNASAFLPALIASVEAASEAASKETAIEWILVDDGSTDNTAEIFLRHAQLNPDWRLVQQVNQGLATTRNNGLSVARGSYIWFVDADDLITTSSLLVLSTWLSRSSGQPRALDMLGFQARTFSDKADGDDIYRRTKPTDPIGGQEWLCNLVGQKELRHFAWIYWYRRDFLNAHQLRFVPRLLHEDVVFTTEAMLYAKWVGFADCCAYKYRLNPSSLTGQRSDEALMNRIDSYFPIVERLRDLKQQLSIDERTRRALKGEIIGQALQIFELAKQLKDERSRYSVGEKSRRTRFVESLFVEVASPKRLRQVIVMWLKQWRLLPIGKEKTK